MLVGRSVCNLYVSCLVPKIFQTLFLEVVQHEGYGAGFFVSDLLPPCALGLFGASF